MTGFLKIRYNAEGLLKNRIVNADSVDYIEPHSGPGGRYVEETRSRIFMKDGTKYDMSVTVEDIYKALREAGTAVAEIQSLQPERQVKPSALPNGSVSLYTRSVIVRPSETARKAPEANGVKPQAVKPPMAKPASVKPAEAVRKPVEPGRATGT